MNWTDEEIKILKLWWPRLNAKAVARRIGRSYPATYQKALALGLESRLFPAKRVTTWVDTYLEVHSHACLLHEHRVPIEIRSQWVGLGTPEYREQFAVFRIRPRRIAKYWEEYG